MGYPSARLRTGIDKLVRLMYERAFARMPTDEELQTTIDYANELAAVHKNPANKATEQQLVWRDVAHALFLSLIHI